MPLIVGGSALPTDKPIIGASGEIHKVVAKNGDVIWEMGTGSFDPNDFTWYIYVTAKKKGIWFNNGKHYVSFGGSTKNNSIVWIEFSTKEEPPHYTFKIKSIEFAISTKHVGTKSNVGLKMVKGHWGTTKHKYFADYNHNSSGFKNVYTYLTKIVLDNSATEDHARQGYSNYPLENSGSKEKVGDIVINNGAVSAASFGQVYKVVSTGIEQGSVTKYWVEVVPWIND